jgi:enoyl-CoA hydratase/carnithine racemase
MQDWVLSEVVGQVGFITLNRANALNALSLSMVRDLSRTLLTWCDDAKVMAVAIRGSDKTGPFGGFCAGGDIRFFHAAAKVGNPELEDFFTEEYALNHLIHNYPKPYVAFMDGVVMGGGMGISQGASVRAVTERTKMAMPETHIGLFPDVGGGYFLSRCPGHLGEWLALTGEVLDGPKAIACGLADRYMHSSSLNACWIELGALEIQSPQSATETVAHCLDSFSAAPSIEELPLEAIEQFFSKTSLLEIMAGLRQDAGDWAQHTIATLQKHSPLMLHVTLEQIRRARHMTLAEVLRMERNLMRHCFYPVHLERTVMNCEAVEGIRALAVDKDHAPRWNPPRVEDVTQEMVSPFFKSPWPTHAHPIVHLV